MDYTTAVATWHDYNAYNPFSRDRSDPNMNFRRQAGALELNKR